MGEEGKPLPTTPEGHVPYSISRIAKHVPEPLKKAALDSELHERLGDAPLSAALKQVLDSDFSEQEWGALLESHAVVSRLESQDEKIQINYRGPSVMGLQEGTNELDLGQWAKWFAVPAGYRVMLFSLVRHLKPKSCLELGTAAGFSALYMSQGLALNEQGELHTVEGDENSHKVGKETLWLVRDYAHAYLGLFEEKMQEILSKIPAPELVFVDGAHNGEEEVRYSEYLASRTNPGAIIIYDDIHWSEEMFAAWEEIRQRPEVSVSVDLGKFGILQTRVETPSVAEPQQTHFAYTPESVLGVGRPTRAGIDPELSTWIFGSPRSGTTWLRDVMKSVEGAEAWEEPFLGDLFGDFYFRRAQAGQLESRNFAMGEPVRAAWIRGIRSFVLDVSKGRFASREAGSRTIVKEPNGSIGAPLIMEAFPESAMVLLVRDPRDVVASYLDASHQGSWLYERRNQGWIRESKMADRDPEEFARRIGEEYSIHVGNAKRAYESHGGPKTLVRYEDLVSDTLGTMRRIYTELGIDADKEELSRAVEKHSWSNIPEDKKGDGKFYRKGSPGSWREDLTPEQAEIVEGITAPLLNEFYPNTV